MAVDTDLMTSTRVRAAAIGVGVAVVLLLMATVRAVVLEPVPEAKPSVTASRGGQTLRGRVVQIDPERVVQTNVFAVNRTAPAARYPMPGEFREQNPSAPLTPPAKPRVLGTAVGSDGNAFATAQQAGLPPQIVRVGDRIGIYTVIAITRGTVTFRAADAAPFQITAS